MTYCGGWLLVPLNNTPLNNNIYSNCSRGKGLLVQCTEASDCVVYTFEVLVMNPKNSRQSPKLNANISAARYPLAAFLRSHSLRDMLESSSMSTSLPTRTFAGPQYSSELQLFLQIHRFFLFLSGQWWCYSNLPLPGLSLHQHSGSNTCPILLQIVVNKWIINMVRSMSNWSTACEPSDPANKIII